MNQDLLKTIWDSHELPQYIQELNHRWEAEQKARHEFLASISDDVKTEFIRGEIVYHLPVTKKHNQISLKLLVSLSKFVEEHQLGFLGSERVLCRFTRNDYEPDICFWGNDKAKDFSDKQTVFPVPDFIVEILPKSTESRDRGIKFEDYALHEVSEYWIVDPEAQTIEQYIHQDRKYTLQVKVKEDSVISQVIKGFAISVEEILYKKTNEL